MNAKRRAVECELLEARLHDMCQEAASAGFDHIANQIRYIIFPVAHLAQAYRIAARTGPDCELDSTIDPPPAGV